MREVRENRASFVKGRRAARALVGLALLLVLASTAVAQTGGPYGLTWGTIDAGGYTFSTGGDYTLGGTIGQPDAGLLTGGDFTLGGGFWGGGALASEEGHEVYLPLVLRGYGSQ
jgi:hypothetical protein